MLNFALQMILYVFAWLTLAWLPLSCIAVSPSDVHKQLQEEQREDRILQGEVTRTDLVRLIPFDVQIAFSYQEKSQLEAIYSVAITDIITDWMSESFEVKSASQLLEEAVNNGTASFDSVGLELVNHRIQTTTVAASQPLALMTTNYIGVSLWERWGSASPMDPDLVELMQRATFLEDNALLELLQAADPSVTGFPSPESVIDVRAYITPPGESNNTPSPAPSPDSDNRNLEIVIIAAIVVACLAFGLLIFAVLWAWQADHKQSTSRTSTTSKPSTPKRSAAAQSNKSNKQLTSSAQQQQVQPPTTKKSFFGSSEQKKNPVTQAKATSAKNNPLPAKTKDPLEGSELDFAGIEAAKTAPPTLTAPNVAVAPVTQNKDPYTDSVLSEDVSSSLTAYYKSGVYSGGGVGGGGGNSNNSRHRSAELNDAASMSSMDSYGYSLDGYAPSLGSAQGGYPIGPLQAAKDAQITVGDEEDHVAVKAEEQEEVEDYEAQT